uniref:Uncharacterized protein n=1 Tax=Rhipicephalus microplus TaxID=6941 RepID=A0A6G5AI42_RHIMP
MCVSSLDILYLQHPCRYVGKQDSEDLEEKRQVRALSGQFLRIADRRGKNLLRYILVVSESVCSVLQKPCSAVSEQCYERKPASTCTTKHGYQCYVLITLQVRLGLDLMKASVAQQKRSVSGPQSIL